MFASFWSAEDNETTPVIVHLLIASRLKSSFSVERPESLPVLFNYNRQLSNLAVGRLISYPRNGTDLKLCPLNISPCEAVLVTVDLARRLGFGEHGLCQSRWPDYGN
jgi:hypothetical protein